MLIKDEYNNYMEKIEEIKAKINPTLKQYDVFRSFIFGSFSKNIASENSDLDLIVEFEGEKSLLDLVSLKLKLEEKLGREVDVLTPDSISPRINEIIQKEKIQIL
ncbi:MAG: nucleotidyltransferase family protein [Patescibacteria group bacterium]